MTDKRLYSLNCSAYVAATTNIMPQVLEDTDTHTAYFVYPECDGVATAIRQYKEGQPKIYLHDFLTAIRFLRKAMKEVLDDGEV